MLNASRKQSWIMKVATGVGLALLLAACGGGASTHTGSQPLNSAATKGLAAAEALVNSAERVPPYVGPKQPIDAARLKGKTVWILVNCECNAFNASIASAAAEALHKVGIHTKILDGQGQVTNWTRQYQEAIAQHVSGIINSGDPPLLLKGPEAAAAAAHIPTVHAISDPVFPLVPGETSAVDIHFGLSGAIQAAYTIAKSRGRAHVLILGDQEFRDEIQRVKSQLAYFKHNCPDCVVTVRNVLLASLPTQVPKLVQSVLHADPKITWILPAYDYLGSFVVQGLKEGGFKGINVVGADAVAQQLDWTRSGGSYYVADVGETPVWCGWAAADEIMRAMLGVPAPPEVIPVRLFVKRNLVGVSDNPSALFRTNFQTPLEKLWGLVP